MFLDLGDHHLTLVQLERIVIFGDRMEGDSEKNKHFVLICITDENISHRENKMITNASITVCNK